MEMGEWLAAASLPDGAASDPGGTKSMAKSKIPGGAAPVGPPVSFVDTAALDQEAYLWTALQTGGAIGPAFRESPLSGCTTLLDMARKSAGYKPEWGEAGQGNDGFLRYVKLVEACPLFEQVEVNFSRSGRRIPSYAGRYIRGTNQLDQFHQDFVEALSPAPFAYPVANRATHDLAEVVNNNASCRDVMFYQATGPGADGIDVVLMRHAIALNRAHDTLFLGIITDVDAWVELLHFQLCFRSKDWPAYADAVLARHFCDVRDWLANN